MFPNHLPLAWDWGLLGFGCVADGLVGALWVLAPRGRACARRKAQGFKAFALCAMGFLVFTFNARFGSLPLPLWGALSGSLMNRCVTGGS